ncbi:hypothetical protein TcCL_NonESM08123 [Trypanosoma cruzi]|nr:hypothetical protein TcCL_NonESM08123 [Trypanosoma cruzi]
MESSRRLPFAKELWIIVLRVCHARRARDGAGIHSTCRRGQGLSHAKSHGWSRQVHAAGKVDPFPSHQEPKECSEQRQQYKAVWHVKPHKMTDKQVCLLPRQGAYAAKISAEHNRFQRMRVRRRHAVKILPPRAG